MPKASSSSAQPHAEAPHKAAKSRTGKSSRAAAPTQASAPSLSPCQRAIQERLKLSPMGSSDALAVLSEAETKQLPSELSAGELLDAGVRLSNTACCFDLASPPSWTAWKICRRCCAVNHVLQMSGQRSSGGSVRNSMLGSALLTTACESQLQRKGVMPTLPNEIIEMIVLAFVYSFNPEFKASGVLNHATLIAMWDHGPSNQSVRGLMHTSHLVRATLTKHFPARLPSCCHVRSSLDTTLAKHHSDVSEQLDAFVRSAVRFYLLDMSQKAARQLVVPKCTDSILVQDNVKVHSVTITVYAPEDRTRLSWSEVQTGKQGHAHKQVDKSAPPLTVGDACQVVSEALQAALPAPDVANPYYRALQWWQKVDPAVSLAIKMEVSGWTFDGVNPSPQVWIFDQHRRSTACPFEGI